MPRSDLRIIFLGTPLFAVPILQTLSENGWPVLAVVTAPDKPVGRKKVLTPSPVKTLAQELQIPVHHSLDIITEIKPDLCVVVAYGKLIGEKYLAVPRLGFINIHPSLLPAYRGPSPIQSALLDGCSGTGVSLMLLDKEMDHGPVLAQEDWTIPAGTDEPFCEAALAKKGAELLVKTLPRIADGSITPHEQNHAQATFTKKFTRQDGRLDWTASAPTIANRIRALGTNPGTWTTWNSKTLNIFHAHPLESVTPAYPPGTVFDHGGHLVVSCGTGSLIIDELQLEGGTRQNTSDFLNGRANIIGGVLT